MSALIVTTPQLLALSDVERQISFCKTVGLSISGIIENMSGYMCPNCTECTNLFSSKGGQSLATKHGVNFLGTLPIDPRLGDLLDNISLDPKLDVISLDTFTPHPHCRTLSDRYSKTVPEMYATMCKVIRSVTRDDLKIS